MNTAGIYLTERCLKLFVTSTVLAFSASLSTRPAAAQQHATEKDEDGIVRRQSFDSLEEALARADVELSRQHRFGVAAIVYTARTLHNERFRGKAELHNIGPSSAGYIPGSLSDGEYILHPLFVTRSANAVRLDILVSGYDRFSRQVILKHGDLLIWDDIVLEPLTGRNSGSISGRLWLEDQDEDLDGIVVSADGEPAAFTDERGYFTIPQIQSGSVRIGATKKNYAPMYTEVSVKAGEHGACVLTGYRKRFARVRWLYQPETTRSFVGLVQSRESVLSPGVLDRVSFAKGFKNVTGRSDFLITQTDDRLILRHFDVSSPDRPASIEIANKTFDEVMDAPESDYDREERILRTGSLFVFRCYDGEHYGMMEVVEVTDVKPHIQDHR